MRDPHLFIAYAPRGAGLRCALAYLEDAGDVYGWFAGPRHDMSIAARYFLLEDFHADTRARYEAVEPAALYSSWALAEPRRYELAAMQAAFARDWLFYRNEPRATVELLAYGGAELAVGEFNLRFERLSKLSKLQPNWTYYSPGFERAVLSALARDWPLEYRPNVGDRLRTARRRAMQPRP